MQSSQRAKIKKYSKKPPTYSEIDVEEPQGVETSENPDNPIPLREPENPIPLREPENRICQLIVQYLLDNLTYSGCMIIGSTAVSILRKSLLTDDFFMAKEGFNTRDIDILTTSSYLEEVYDILSFFGTISTKSDVSEYGILLHRGITRIVKCELSISGKSTGLASQIIKLFANVDIKLQFDLVIVDAGTNASPDLLTISKKWIMGDLSRMFAIYTQVIDGKKILIPKILGDIKFNPHFYQPSLVNLLEWICNAIHLYGGDVIGYTPSGDRYTVIPFENKFATDMNQYMDVMGLVDIIRRGKTFPLLKIRQARYWSNAILLRRENIVGIVAEMWPNDSANKRKIIVDKIGKSIREDNCVICGEKLLDKNNYKVISNCHHIFCLHCLFTMIKRYIIFRVNRINNIGKTGDEEDNTNNCCPICRTILIDIPLVNKTIHPHFKCRDIKIPIENLQGFFRVDS